MFRTVRSWPVLVALFVALAVVAVPVFIASSDAGEVTRRERDLLYRTDHPVVLAACREVFANQATYRRNPEWNNRGPGRRTDLPDPEDPNIPAAIRDLHPTTIEIGPDYVRLEWGGGFLHFGLIGYLPGAPGHGTKKLLDGLWYDAEDGTVPPP
jgi:hypothetical protein